LNAFARGDDFDLWAAGSTDRIVSWFSEALPSNDSTWKQHDWIACNILEVNTDIPRTIEATDFAITKADGRRRWIIRKQ
jgi:hypothetical protein